MPLRMAGQYADDEVGLFYNYFRYYDPKNGRYITSDPIGLRGGLNTYGYVYGDPLYWVDPYGLGAKGAGIGGAVGAGGGAIGGLGGGIGAGAACTVVAPGAGTVGCGTAGGVAGATQGAIIGGAIGAVVGNSIENIIDVISEDVGDFCPPDNAIFAKGGKQNIDNEYVRLVQNQRPPDPCEFLNKLYNAENNKKERDKINKARKRFNCDGKNRFK